MSEGLAQTKEELKAKLERLRKELQRPESLFDKIAGLYTPINDLGDFNPVLFGKLLLETFSFKTDAKTKTIWIYDPEARIYKPDGENLIQTAMARRLDEETRQRYFADICFYIRGITFTDKLESPKDKIAVSNGVLNVLTRELVECSPEEFLTVKIPVKYDPKAECPAIKQFLLEVLGENQITIAQELAGYCLYQAMPIHKAIMCVGQGHNGKSTFLSLMIAFLGKENVSNQTLQALCSNRFAPAHLHGKLANICADLPDNALAHTGMFKMLTGNDAIFAEEKFKQGFSFINIAKLLFSTNKVPESNDDTDAFFRRWIILAFINIFIGIKCDKHILERLTTPTELSGFLNFALEGLSRLLENGEFINVGDLEQMRSQYIRQSNSAKAYIEEKLEYDSSDKAIILETKLYQNYIAYCEENNLPTMKKRNFTENMQQYMAKAKQTMSRMEGKPVHVWQYVAFKESVTTVTPDILSDSFNGYSIELSNREVTVVTDSLKANSEPFFSSCFVCGEPIWTQDWQVGEITANKPAHKECFTSLEAGLRRQAQ